MILEVVGMCHVRVVFSINNLVLMMIMVVCSIFLFVKYYIRDDVSNRNFELVMIIFLMLIIIMLSGYRILIFLG